MEPIEFRQVHRRVDGVSVEVWLEFRVAPLLNGIEQPFTEWRRLDAVQAVDQNGQPL